MRVPSRVAVVAALAAFAVAGQAAAGEVVVRRGDTLSGLAKRAGVSVRDLAGANGITNLHLIREGQTLR
ncbi:MAG: LysM peptidoglycan-binding domain-containing protein, partial [Actinomycetota bacterium]